jgi:hypothetical protein
MLCTIKDWHENQEEKIGKRRTDMFLLLLVHMQDKINAAKTTMIDEQAIKFMQAATEQMDKIRKIEYSELCCTRFNLLMKRDLINERTAKDSLNWPVMLRVDTDEAGVQVRTLLMRLCPVLEDLKVDLGFVIRRFHKEDGVMIEKFNKKAGRAGGKAKPKEKSKAKPKTKGETKQTPSTRKQQDQGSQEKSKRTKPS